MDVDDRTGGFVISQPRPAGEPQDARKILQDFDMDPDAWSVTSVRRGKWQKFDGEYLESLRINIVPIRFLEEDRIDAEKLVDEIKKWRPASGIKTQTGEGAFALFPSDQQIGKKTGSGGTEQSIERILSLTETSVA
jgi:hypothetical protein